MVRSEKREYSRKVFVIPAIDLKDGRCVRLLEGKMDTAWSVSPDPLAQARTFEEAGAKRLHVVDLDGAIEGGPKNADLIGAIIRAVAIPVQVGGGLRTPEAVAAFFDRGAAYAILGTLLVEDPAAFSKIAADHPGRIIAGIDAKDGRVATQGWVVDAGLDAISVARRAETAGAAAVITTDIARDGTGRGVNVDFCRSLAEAVAIPVIASGGVHSAADLERLEGTGVAGVVVGRALYDGTLDFAQAFSPATKSI